MREHTVDTLLARYDELQQDTRFDEWRTLTQDVLAALVRQQGVVIALQRQALERLKLENAEERQELRVRADAAFAIVQRLHQLRRKVHALLNKRDSATDSKYTATALRAAG